MNRDYCEREDRTSAAIRGGRMDHETAWHVQECAVCSDIVLVSKFLNEDAALPDHERPTLPGPTLIWQRADLRANQGAVRLALRPIRYMKVLACVAFVCSPWLRLLLPISRELAASWLRTLDLDLVSASKLWPTMANQSTVLLSALGTLILLGLSSWCMLRQE